MMTIYRGKYCYKVRDMGTRQAKFVLTNTENNKGLLWFGADTQANRAAKSNIHLDEMIEKYKKYLD